MENESKKTKGEITMAANVETMFSVREKPWHGLGTVVAEAPKSAEALELAGLDWRVEQTPIDTKQMSEILMVRYWELSLTDTK